MCYQAASHVLWDFTLVTEESISWGFLVSNWGIWREQVDMEDLQWPPKTSHHTFEKNGNSIPAIIETSSWLTLNPLFVFSQRTPRTSKLLQLWCEMVDFEDKRSKFRGFRNPLLPGGSSTASKIGEQTLINTWFQSSERDGNGESFSCDTVDGSEIRRSPVEVW